jgi:hypothetical protein
MEKTSVGKSGANTMSSLWDSLASKHAQGILTFAEFADLLEFLREFDAAHDGIITKPMPRYMKAYYKFTTLEQLEKDVQSRGISKQGLAWFIEELHDIDHSIDQVMMYTFNPGKHDHYWVKHKAFRSMMGTFKGGKWVKKT